jgi:hypothetical protein
MDVLTTLMIVGVATVAGETVIRVAKARAGGATRLQAHLDQLQQQFDDQSSAWQRSSRTLLVRRSNSESSRIDWTLPSGC